VVVDFFDVGKDSVVSLELFCCFGWFGVLIIVIDDRVFVGFEVHW